VVGGDLLLAPTSVTASAIAMMLRLMLVWLAQQAPGTRALGTLALVVWHQRRVAQMRGAARVIEYPAGMPLHPLAEKFAAVAESYDRGRPEYAPAVVGALASELRLERAPTCLTWRPEQAS
jgi:hypothetical protein